MHSFYTKDSYQALTEALNAAKAEFDRTDSTEESVKAAVDKIRCSDQSACDKSKW